MRSIVMAASLASALPRRLLRRASKRASRPGRKATTSGAVAIWRPLAEAGDADAAFNLGQAYRLGKGVPTDLAAAQTWFERAARKGHVDAQTTPWPAVVPQRQPHRCDALAQAGSGTGRAARAADLWHRFVQRRRGEARSGARIRLCQPRRGARPCAGQGDAGRHGRGHAARAAAERRRAGAQAGTVSRRPVAKAAPSPPKIAAPPRVAASSASRPAKAIAARPRLRHRLPVFGQRAGGESSSVPSPSAVGERSVRGYRAPLGGRAGLLYPRGRGDPAAGRSVRARPTLPRPARV